MKNSIERSVCANFFFAEAASPEFFLRETSSQNFFSFTYFSRETRFGQFLKLLLSLSISITTSENIKHVPPALAGP